MPTATAGTACGRGVRSPAVGLVLLAYETGDEAAFINVVGDNINFKSICSLGLGMHGRWHRHLSDCFDDF